MSKINDEFKETALKINAKLAEAAAALREANRLGEDAGLYGLIHTQDSYPPLFSKILSEEIDEEEEDEYDVIEDIYNLIDTSPIEKAMRSGGWSTSSSYC